MCWKPCSTSIGAGGGPAVYGATAIPCGIMAMALSVGVKRLGFSSLYVGLVSLPATAEIMLSYLSTGPDVAVKVGCGKGRLHARCND